MVGQQQLTLQDYKEKSFQIQHLNPQECVREILKFIGEDPSREGLLDTPKRVVKSWSQIFSGYNADITEIMTYFTEQADEMVVLRDIEFYSNCEHHMQPFFGKAHIAYLPDNRVVGVSKLARLLDVFSKRLQIQERLTSDITSALDQHLRPKGSACVIEAKHFCMMCRGVGKQNSTMVTSSLTGAFKTDPTVRAEFLQLVRQ